MNPRPGIEGRPAPDFALAQTLAADGTPAAAPLKPRDAVFACGGRKAISLLK